MCSFIIVAIEPNVQIFLQALQVEVDLFPEGDLIELLQNGLVKSFTDTIGLWASRFRLRVVDVLDRQVELILVMFSIAAILGATIREGTQ